MAVLSLTEAELECHRGLELTSAEPEQALTHLTKALTLGCREREMFTSLSGLLLQLRQSEEAWKVCELGLQHFPDEPWLLCNQGVAYGLLGFYQEALERFEKQASKLKRNQRPWTNIGNMLGSLGRLSEAKYHLQTGQQYDPVATYNLSLAYLLEGNLKVGFRLFETRPSVRQSPLSTIPFWDGSDIAGKRLLLFCEQGVGDAMQCARYITALNERGIQPIFGLPPNLQSLFRGLPGQYSVALKFEEAGVLDTQCALFSLPHLLGTEMHNIPPPLPFRIDETRRKLWTQRLSHLKRARVALVWAGNATHGNDRQRSLPLSSLQPILNTADVDFISVQMGPATSQIAEFGLQNKIFDASPLIQDFADTAAILSQVDLLITVDTSVAHLAGNQGVPVWTMIPFAPDWRWLRDRDDSPWYPSMRLFRQSAPRDWAGVIERVADQLRERIQERKQPPFPVAATPSLAGLAARFIPQGSSVLDLHAGPNDLASHLLPNCSYQSCNIATDELPETSDASHVTMLGVLDQVEAWKSLLIYLRGLNKPVILSYRPTDMTTAEERARLGCANHLSLLKLLSVFHQLAFEVVGSTPADVTETIFHLLPKVSGQQATVPCPICSEDSFFLKPVDFNKSCEENRGQVLPKSGISICYAHCSYCGFTFAPEMLSWSQDEFAAKVYNEEYYKVDPDYLSLRPENNAKNLIATLGSNAAVRHLDYGGGGGLLSRRLRESGWNSSSYDPFIDGQVNPADLGTFDLITAFEVFEHVPDAHALMKKLKSLLAGNGIVIFSTLLSDGEIHPNRDVTWWYASPRNGHISLFSRQSLGLLADRHGFKLASYSAGTHVFFRTVPAWGRNLFSSH